MHVLTSFAIIVLKNWDAKGIHFRDSNAQKELRLNHPSSEDLKSQLDELRKQVMEIEENPRFKQRKELVDEGLRKDLSRSDQNQWIADTNAIGQARGFQKELTRFIAGQEYDFGFVAAASGFQTARASTMPSDLSKSSLDWALIDVPSRRLGKNIVSII